MEDSLVYCFWRRGHMLFSITYSVINIFYMLGLMTLLGIIDINISTLDVQGNGLCIVDLG